MSELKGCPICGGEIHLEDFDQMPCPVCEKCGCVFSFYKEDYSREEVAELFNSRPLEDSLRARIGELEKETAPFRDPYFKDLSMSAIAELAKKSIKLTEQHNKDTARIAELEEALIKAKVAMDWLGDRMNDMDVVEEQDTAITTPLFEDVDKVLKVIDPDGIRVKQEEKIAEARGEEALKGAGK